MTKIDQLGKVVKILNVAASFQIVTRNSLHRRESWLAWQVNIFVFVCIELALFVGLVG
ncbi:MAG: hypothetical protein KDD53_05260 [Bdellovibrionales bacterium]|nr:hypothetical protein [Bdellovibrionales bacterium]